MLKHVVYLLINVKRSLYAMVFSLIFVKLGAWNLSKSIIVFSLAQAEQNNVKSRLSLF